MAQQLYIAHYLEELLQYWEDCNLAGEFQFQLHLATKGLSPDLDGRFEALTGSEINIAGIFVREIPEYKKLRSVLSGYSYDHPTGFLPRIPKDLRYVFKNPIQLGDVGIIDVSCTIPQFLLDWNETRRAFVITEDVPLLPLSLVDGNWLSYLPYESFYLKLSSPLIFSGKRLIPSKGGYVESEDSDCWSISNILVSRKSGLIRILVWTEESTQFLFSIEEREKLTKAISRIKHHKTVKSDLYVNRLKTAQASIGQAMFSFCLQEGSCLLYDPSINKDENGLYNIEDKYINLYTTTIVDDFEDEQRQNFQQFKALIGTLNSFCKMMYEIHSSSCHNPAIPADNDQTESVQEGSRTRWYELPLEEVEYLRTEEVEGKVVLRHGSGSEKSPHVRRAHARKYVQKDGTVKIIWVEQTIVRKDKLANELLQGSAKEIR